MLGPSVVQQQRIALVSAGYARVIVESLGKKPVESLWPERSRQAILEVVSQQWPTNDALNTGVLCDDLCAIDIDVDENQELVGKVVELARQLLGSAPIRWRENSTRALALYRVSDFSKAQRHKTINGTHGRVDILTGHKQFVAYGEHESGAEYKWTVDLKTIPRASLPVVTYEAVRHFRVQLCELMGEIPSHVPSMPAAFVPCALPQGFHPIPTRPQATKHELDYAQAALRNEVAKVAKAPSGTRNDALNIAAHSLGTCIGAGWIEREQVERELCQAMIANGSIADDGERAARDTLASGIGKGMLKPRDPLPLEVLGDLPANLVDPRTTKGTGKDQAANSTAVSGRSKSKSTVVLTGLASIRPTVIDWLWPGYLPKGMLTLLAGPGGSGKSTLAFSLAAIVTTAGQWPDGSRCVAPGNVLIWSSEDDLARTIVPRLIAARADLDRIASVEGVLGDQGLKMPFDPALHMDDLRRQVSQISGGVSLLIIDPIVSAVTGDMNKATDVRRSLQPMLDFAAEIGSAVLGITHFPKNTNGKNPTERVLGSQSFSAVARMVIIAKQEEDSEQRVFTRTKSNISEDGGGFGYTIQQFDVQAYDGRIIKSTRVVWGEALVGSARSILGAVEGEDVPQSGKKSEEARNFLYRVLADGPVPVVEVKAQARAAGIASVTLQRVKEAMNIQSIKTKGEFVGSWDWSLAHHHLTVAGELLHS
jgi:energy-coupling factor transporter ATP-binding protein EcfA2